MRSKLYLYAIGVWGLLVFMAILNAGLREGVISPALGDQAGHVLSSIILSAIIFLITYLFLKYVDLDYTNQDLLLVGALWLALTVSFEFLFGHFVMGNSWDTLLSDYNVFKGRVWVLVLITTFVSPMLAERHFL
ncbi:MAG: hypothetical protein KGY76_07950 [Candidatus Thermoplasmatota archaeon]|nr:hypothetical protein [Candidatus Thermoplasmatota archaeon]